MADTYPFVQPDYDPEVQEVDEMQRIPHYDLLLVENCAVLAANYLYKKSLSKYHSEWGKRTYKFFKYLDRNQRDETNTMAVAPQELIEATDENVAKYLSFVNRMFGVRLGRWVKTAYQDIVVAACKADGFRLGHQDPQTIHDVMTIISGHEFQKMAIEDREKFFSFLYKWFHQPVSISVNTTWVANAVNSWMRSEGMLGYLGNGHNEQFGKRTHSIISQALKGGTNGTITELRKACKSTHHMVLEVGKLVTTSSLQNTDWSKHERIELDANVTTGTRRKGGNVFLVLHMPGSPFLRQPVRQFTNMLSRVITVGVHAGMSMESIVEIAGRHAKSE